MRQASACDDSLWLYVWHPFSIEPGIPIHSFQLALVSLTIKHKHPQVTTFTSDHLQTLLLQIIKDGKKQSEIPVWHTSAAEYAAFHSQNNLFAHKNNK